MEQVCHLTNKIYREILYIKTHEWMMYITMGGLDHIQVSAFKPSWTLQYTGRIVLSWDLLAWISVKGRIPSSFTNFITTPELSGPLYISPDIYHTQITEYLLERIYRFEPFSLCIKHHPNCYSVRPPSLRLHRCKSFKEHLSHAHPTEMILYLLRSIPIKSLTRDYSAELILDTLEIIIDWLQVSVSECNGQMPQTKNPILSTSDLVPSDQPICTIASRVNLVDANLKPPLKQSSFSPTSLDYGVLDLSVSLAPAISCCNQCNQHSKIFFI